MSAFAKRILRASIWARGAVPASEGRAASDVKRGLLPAFDLVLIGAAILAIRGGMPSFAIIYNDTVSDVAAWALLITTTGCLVGVSFPRLWLLEALAKSVMIAILLVYSGVLLGLSAVEPTRGFVGGVTLAVCLLPAWRILWLGREYRSRKGA